MERRERHHTEVIGLQGILTCYVDGAPVPVTISSSAWRWKAGMSARVQTVYRKVSALRLRELWLLTSSAGLLMALPVLQRMLTLPALVRFFCAKTMPMVLPPLEPDRLLFLIRGLLLQQMGLFRPNCMKQALVLFHFLRLWGDPVALYFGVAKHGGALGGHCWVELAGQPFGERDNPRRAFTIIYKFPEDNLPMHERSAR